MSVIHNTQYPDSTLNKKSDSICYHEMRESVAIVDSITAHIGTNKNITDLGTKVLYGGKRNHMFRNNLYDIYDDAHS